jgi:hypothetical protein
MGDLPNACAHGSSCGSSSKMCRPFVGRHILDLVQLSFMSRKGTHPQARWSS